VSRNLYCPTTPRIRFCRSEICRGRPASGFALSLPRPFHQAIADPQDFSWPEGVRFSITMGYSLSTCRLLIKANIPDLHSQMAQPELPGSSLDRRWCFGALTFRRHLRLTCCRTAVSPRRQTEIPASHSPLESPELHYVGAVGLRTKIMIRFSHFGFPMCPFRTALSPHVRSATSLAANSPPHPHRLQTIREQTKRTGHLVRQPSSVLTVPVCFTSTRRAVKR